MGLGKGERRRVAGATFFNGAPALFMAQSSVLARIMVVRVIRLDVL